MIKSTYPQIAMDNNAVTILRNNIKKRLTTITIILMRNKYLFFSHNVLYNPSGDTIKTFTISTFNYFI